MLRSVARLEWPDGSVFEGEVSTTTGKPEGVGRIAYLGGNYYEGEWQNGKRHGYGVSVIGGLQRRELWHQGEPQQTPPTAR